MDYYLNISNQEFLVESVNGIHTVKAFALETSFEEKFYTVKIIRVSVYPQCYASVVNQIPTLGRKALVVDVGSWTIDYMPILDKAPVIFVGGGARVIKNFGKYKINNVKYVFDVKVNAKGYDTLARISLRNER